MVYPSLRDPRIHVVKSGRVVSEVLKAEEIRTDLGEQTKVLLERQEIREVMLKWWHWIPRPRSWLIDWDTFRWLNILLFDILVPIKSTEKLELADTAAEEDWKVFSRGEDALDFGLFARSMLELANNFTDHLNFSEFAPFLEDLLTKTQTKMLQASKPRLGHLPRSGSRWDGEEGIKDMQILMNTGLKSADHPNLTKSKSALADHLLFPHNPPRIRIHGKYREQPWNYRPKKQVKRYPLTPMQALGETSKQQPKGYQEGPFRPSNEDSVEYVKHMPRAGGIKTNDQLEDSAGLEEEESHQYAITFQIAEQDSLHETRRNVYERFSAGTRSGRSATSLPVSRMASCVRPLSSQQRARDKEAERLAKGPGRPQSALAHSALLKSRKANTGDQTETAAMLIRPQSETGHRKMESARKANRPGSATWVRDPSARPTSAFRPHSALSAATTRPYSALSVVTVGSGIPDKSSRDCSPLKEEDEPPVMRPVSALGGSMESQLSERTLARGRTRPQTALAVRNLYSPSRDFRKPGSASYSLMSDTIQKSKELHEGPTDASLASGDEDVIEIFPFDPFEAKHSDINVRISRPASAEKSGFAPTHSTSSIWSKQRPRTSSTIGSRSVVGSDFNAEQISPKALGTEPVCFSVYDILDPVPHNLSGALSSHFPGMARVTTTLPRSAPEANLGKAAAEIYQNCESVTDPELTSALSVRWVPAWQLMTPSMAVKTPFVQDVLKFGHPTHTSEIGSPHSSAQSPIGALQREISNDPSSQPDVSPPGLTSVSLGGVMLPRSDSQESRTASAGSGSLAISLDYSETLARLDSRDHSESLGSPVDATRNFMTLGRSISDPEEVSKIRPELPTRRERPTSAHHSKSRGPTLRFQRTDKGNSRPDSPVLSSKDKLPNPLEATMEQRQLVASVLLKQNHEPYKAPLPKALSRSNSGQGKQESAGPKRHRMASSSPTQTGPAIRDTLPESRRKSEEIIEWGRPSSFHPSQVLSNDLMDHILSGAPSHQSAAAGTAVDMSL